MLMVAVLAPRAAHAADGPATDIRVAEPSAQDDYTAGRESYTVGLANLGLENPTAIYNGFIISKTFRPPE